MPPPTPVDVVLALGAKLPNRRMLPSQWVAAFDEVIAALETMASQPLIELSEVERTRLRHELVSLKNYASQHRPSLKIAYAEPIAELRGIPACPGQTLTIVGSGFGTPPLVHVQPPSSPAGPRLPHVPSPGQPHPVPPGHPARPLPSPTGRAPHPDERTLLLPTLERDDAGPLVREALVPRGHWTDGQIDLPLPEWAACGSVGFMDLAVQATWEEYTASLSLQVNRILTSMGVALATPASDIPTRIQSPPPTPPKPLQLEPPTDRPTSTGRNHLLAGKPVIAVFGANGSADPVLSPGEEVVIAWSVVNGDGVRIEQRRGSERTCLRDGAGLEGSMVYTPPIGWSDAVLMLIAWNACGEVRRATRVHVRIATSVSILGIEVTQALQEFSFDDASRQNVVPLVRGKRTLVRAYLDTALPSDGSAFHLARVSGSLQVGGRTFAPTAEITLLHTDPSTARRNLGSSLNFIVTGDAINAETVKLDLRVFSRDPYAMWTPLETSRTLSFESPRTLDLYLFFVRDKFGNRATMEEAQASLDRLRALYPIASEGINVKGWFDLDTDLDFHKGDAWFAKEFWKEDLFDLLEQAASDLDDKGEVFCAIVAEASCSNPKGRGWPGGLDWCGGSSERLAYWRATAGSEPGSYIEAHEIGHALNLDDCGGSTGLLGAELRDMLPPAVREPDSHQMMTKYSSERWISAVEYLFLHYRDPGTTFWKCTQLGLPGSIDVFYIGV